MAKRRKAPANTYWVGDTLYGKITIPGRKGQYRWSLHTDNPELASRLVKTQKQENKASAYHGVAPSRSMIEVTIEWTAACKGRLFRRMGKATLDRYLRSLKQLAPWTTGKSITEIDGALTRDIITGRSVAGISVNTIKKDLAALSSVIDFALVEGYVDSNPVAPRMKALHFPKVPIILPERGDVETVIRRAPKRFGDMIRGFMETGCRLSELRDAKRNQFSDNRRQLTVIGKGNKQRTLDLSDAAYVAIRPTAHDSVWLFTNESGGNYSDASKRITRYVAGRDAQFKNNAGTGLAKSLAARKAANEVTPFSAHKLRHYFAVNYLKNGGRIDDLADILGHSTVVVTYDYLRGGLLTTKEKELARRGPGIDRNGTIKVASGKN
jgi:integrase/recombinase XerD